MKIIVCVKQVPAKDSPLRLNDDATWIRESDLSYEMNEPDAYALEAALQLKEKHGGEVVVLSAGPPRVQQVIREALAKGADRAIHIECDSEALLGTNQLARVMAEAIRREPFDLVLTGLQSDDLGLGQTGVILAELLNVPHATIIMEVQVNDQRLRVKRELEAGWFQWVEMPMPALLTIQSGINKLRYATLMGIKKAKTKELRRLTVADLDSKPGSGARQKLHRIHVPVKSKKTEFIEGGPKEAAARLVERLRTQARIL